MWVGLLFAMMCMAAQMQQNSLDSESASAGAASRLDSETPADTFREKIVQCLLLGKYTKGGPYSLETLILYFAGEFLSLKDSSADTWILVGMIVHLAMRMGYHRDPVQLPGISPFEGEMRRRVWATVFQLDFMVSSEIGLPRTAKDAQIDTKEPRNLLDIDFDEDTMELPPPRPDTDMTVVLYLIARGRISSVLGLISDLNTDTRASSYQEVIKIDQKLEEVRQTIPAAFKWRPMAQSIIDPPSLVLQRLYLDAIYHKAKILLHRRSLITGSSQMAQNSDIDSRQTCLDAAIKLLEYQQVLDEEIQPAGRFYHLRWKVSHLTNHDTLLATSILCLYLQMTDSIDIPDAAPRTAEVMRREEIRQRLRTSHQIWLRLSATSVEAQKAARALTIVLGDAETDTTANVHGDLCADFEPMPFDGYGAPTPYQCEKHTQNLNDRQTDTLRG